jgi:hypothetical protein
MYRTMKRKNFQLMSSHANGSGDYAMFGLFLTKKGVQKDTLELHYEFVAKSGPTTIQGSADASSAFIILILVASGLVTIGF